MSGDNDINNQNTCQSKSSWENEGDLLSSYLNTNDTLIMVIISNENVKSTPNMSDLPSQIFYLLIKVIINYHYSSGRQQGE